MPLQHDGLKPGCWFFSNVKLSALEYAIV